MSKVLIFRRRHLRLLSAALLALALAGVLGYFMWEHKGAQPAGGQPEGLRIIHMVTGEYKATAADGHEIEAYRWDPGTIFVEKGERVNLVLYGVNGESHPFYIEGTSIKGEVRQGKETSVIFQASKEGVYRLICLAHPDRKHNGPMIAYIVVD